MDQDLKVFRDLVLWLWRSHEKPWEYEDSEARQIYDQIQVGYASIGEGEIELLLPTEDDVRSEFSRRRRYLYLNPIKVTPTLVPVLSIKADFGRSIPELRLRLGFFLMQEGQVKAFGFRFESPEGPGEDHYYHAQFIHGFENDRPFGPEHIWLPVTCPTFPLDADNPVKLLLTLVVALYGLPSLTQVKTSVAGIEKHLSEMRCLSFKEFEYYWIATMRRDRQEYYISTDIDPESFDKKFREAHQGCEIKRITKGRYEGQTRQHRWDGTQLQTVNAIRARKGRSSRV